MNQVVIKTQRGVGPTIRGIATVSVDPFSPRYDLNRETGVITRLGHSLNGLNIKGRILLFPSAKGGVAAGWAYFDLYARNLAPAAFVFQTVNTVMVQGAVMAGIPILDGISVADYQKIKTGDELEIDGDHCIIRVFNK